MEDIKDRLGDYKYNFFYNLQNYLNTELIFFGSIKRIDFFEKASDIDIIIITENVKSLLSKIQNYLNIDKNSIQKIVQQYSIYDKRIISGYKLKYKDNNNSDLFFDILIYDDKYREDVMKNVDDINNLPLYIIIILYILKLFYYRLALISSSTYNNLKCFLFHCYFNRELKFYDKQHSTTIMMDNYLI
jgi:predicted nucleotidyltransferase